MSADNVWTDSNSTDTDFPPNKQPATTANRKAADVAPGSVRVRGQVTVHGVAPSWEGDR